MKLQPLISQYALALPKFTSLFTEALTITSATQSGGIATIVTSQPHNLIVGQTVNIRGVNELVPLTSLTPNAGSITEMIGRSALNNGLSLAMNFKDKEGGNPEVELVNSTQTQFNGVFPLVQVPNRNAFIATIANTGAATDLPQLINYAYNYYDGFQAVNNVINPTTFTFAINSNASQTTTNTGLVHYSFRMNGALNLERAVAFYTAQNVNQYWLILIPGESTTSKNRFILNDTPNNILQGGLAFRQRVMETFHALVFAPTSDDTSAIDVHDTVENAKVALINSMCGFSNRTTQQFYEETNFVYVYYGGENVVYNTAFLVNQFTFGTTFDITGPDLWKEGDFVPLLNIDQTQLINNEGILTANINVDVNPNF